MESELDSKIKRILESQKSSKQPSYKRIPSSSYHHCSDDQIEEAETVGFSWTVEDIMNGTGETSESNRFSQNPAAVPLMASCYLSSSDLYAGFCPLTLESTDLELDFDYHDLLDAQNAGWGQQKVLEGITAAREEKYEISIEFCSAALSFLPHSVEALVCRGASYANISKIDKAAEDFEKALRIDPSNQNATQYLRKITDNVLKTTPNTVILPVEAVETRKPEWRVIPSKVKLPVSARDLIKLGTSSSSSVGAFSGHEMPSLSVATVNGYAFEREESRTDSSSESESSRSSNTKKRKRDKDKVKKSKKEDKKKKHKRKDKKKEKKRKHDS